MRPPIEGLPKDRPRCPFCDGLLRPVVQELRADGQDRFAVNADSSKPITRRIFQRWDGYAIERGNAFDLFCRLRCARDFANAAFRAGYRITRKEGK